MGYVNTKITLKNSRDIFKAKDGHIKEQDIRQLTVDAIVDTGASTLVINQELFQKLGLEAIDQRVIRFANNETEICTLTEPIEIHWENRFIPLPALVVKDAAKVLLGVLPLEGMDLIVDTINQKLVGAHGEEPMYIAV